MTNSSLEKELRKVPDKILHCLARTIQTESVGTHTKCLYCKYAPECAKEFHDSERLLSNDILNELVACTSVKIFMSEENKAEDMLKGSWAEKYPDVLNMLTSKSFDEQLDILMNKDILKYLDKKLDK